VQNDLKRSRKARFCTVCFRRCGGLAGSVFEVEEIQKHKPDDRPHKEGVLFGSAGLFGKKKAISFFLFKQTMNGAPKSCPFRDVKNTQKDFCQRFVESFSLKVISQTNKKKTESDSETPKTKNRPQGRAANKKNFRFRVKEGVGLVNAREKKGSVHCKFLSLSLSF